MSLLRRLAYKIGAITREYQAMIKRQILNTFAAAALLTAGAAPAFARTQDSQGSASDGASAASEKKVCKHFHNTVTRLGRERVCLTRAEWQKVYEGY
jgi:hypothetical protein